MDFNSSPSADDFSEAKKKKKSKKSKKKSSQDILKRITSNFDLKNEKN